MQHKDRYPLQSKVHERVSARDLPFECIQPLPDVYSAESKYSVISFALHHLLNQPVWELNELLALVCLLALVFLVA